MLEKVQAALAAGTVVDGHAPALAGRELIAYAAAGIRSDHESTTVEEARAKAALGMLVQVREGSSAQNLDALLPLLAGGELDDSWCLATDDIFPNDLRRHGHLDGLLRRLVAGGVAPAVAVRHAAYVPARHYGLIDRGAPAPGYRADLVLVEDLQDFRVRTVIKDGRVAARDGQCLDDGTAPRLDHENTVHLPPLDEGTFRLPLASETCPVIEIVPGQIVTRRTSRSVRRVDGRWAFDPERDVVLIASIERHRASGRIGLGLVSGFGLTHDGALGSSVAHDSHNLIIAGTNARDMLACARALAEHGGGFVAASGGAVQALLPLPVAGLLSLEDADTVCRQLDEVNRAAQALGCPLDAPFGTLSFLALPVIPELRITDPGRVRRPRAAVCQTLIGNAWRSGPSESQGVPRRLSKRVHEANVAITGHRGVYTHSEEEDLPLRHILRRFGDHFRRLDCRLPFRTDTIMLSLTPWGRSRAAIVEVK